MKGILFSFFVLFTFLFSHTVQAQKQRDHYGLLWKISGNGLSKPSYLFGTMHLTDQRVFDFSDSVIVKIQECDGFALEFSPDSVSQFIAQMIMNQNSENIVTRDFKKELTKQEYDILKQKLLSDASINLDQIKDKTPGEIANLLNSPVLSKNDKSNFLDGYLYRIALGEKKKMFGLEKASDRTELSESTYEKGMKELRKIIHASEYEKTLDKWIEVYHEGDIDQINRMMMERSDSSIDILNYRNHNMADRIQEISPVQSVFYAVGAAHLVGEEGLISLLRKKGFTVTKVEASFTGQAGRYQLKPVDHSWQRYEKNGYSITLPSKPVAYPLTKKASLDLQVCPDLSTGLFYFVMTVPVPEGYDEKEVNNFSDTFIKNMSKSKNTKGVKKKSVIFKGVKGTDVDFFIAKQNMYGKVRVMQKFGMVYLMMILSFKKENLKSQDINSFFQSFEFLKPNPIAKPLEDLTDSSKQEEKITYTSKAGAYSVEAACKLESYFREENDDSSDVTKTFFVTGQDNEGLSYWSGYYLLPKGTSIVEDSTYMADIVLSMTDDTDSATANVQDITYKGYPGKSFYVTEKLGYLAHVQIVLRGSRMHMLFAVGRESKVKQSKKVTEFLASLQLLPYEKTAWTAYESKEDGIQWNTKGNVLKKIDSTGIAELPYEISYSSIDTCSGISYIVVTSSFSPYYSLPKEDFIAAQKKDYLAKTDSIVYEKTRTINGIEAIEWIVKLKNSRNQKRILVVPVGNKIVCMCAYFLPEVAQSEFSDPFFSSLKFTHPKAKAGIYESKAKQLLMDLSSKDSTVSQDALSMLSYYHFRPAEKELVYAELHKTFADDSLSYENTRSVLLSRLTDLEDTTTVSFIQSLYPELTIYPGLQIIALRTLLQLKSVSSKETLFQMINTEIPDVTYIPYDFFATLKDSIALNAALYPELFTLIKSSSFRNDLYGLAVSLLDSNLIKKELFTLHMDQLLAFSKEDLESAENYNTPYLAVWNSITFFGRFTDQKAVLDYLIEMSHYTDDVLAFEAVTQLINHKIAVDPAVLLHFAAENKYRLTLYNLLKDSGQTNWFPAKWYKQEYFAEADMYNYMGGYEDEYYYEKIQLINSKVITYKGVSSRFFLFKLLSEGEWYVGISGPFDLDQQKVLSDATATRSLFETLKSKSINAHYEDLLKEEEELSFE